MGADTYLIERQHRSLDNPTLIHRLHKARIITAQNPTTICWSRVSVISLRKIHTSLPLAIPKFPSTPSPELGSESAAPKGVDGIETLPKATVSLTLHIEIVLAGPPSP
jgi:hypothetical protein